MPKAIQLKDSVMSSKWRLETIVSFVLIMKGMQIEGCDTIWNLGTGFWYQESELSCKVLYFSIYIDIHVISVA